MSSLKDALNMLSKKKVNIQGLKCKKCLKSKKGVKKMNDFDLHKILKVLSKERPLFHSEADFKFALACKIKEEISPEKIIIEYPESICDKRIYIDIYFKKDNKEYYLELKYKTKKLIFNNEEMKYNLKDQKACDFGRYDFIKDIERLEKITCGTQDKLGYVIFLSNDENYLQGTKKTNQDYSFNIENNTTITRGEKSWSKEKILKNLGSRKNSLNINNDYFVQWRNYSNFKNYEFNYLAIKIKEMNIK